MKNGHDQHDEGSNIVSLAGARKQAKAAARASAVPPGRAEHRTSAGQWLMSAFLVMLGIGGVFALAVPLLRAAGIAGG
jgi:hypothetical protein